MQPKKEITIYDIAKEAGVSPSTVSRILSGSAGVRPEKRERVRRLVEKYDFKPNAMARSLSKTSSKVIGMLCPDMVSPYYGALFMECARAAYEQGYTLVLNNAFANSALEMAYLEKMMEQRVESIILCGGTVDWRPMPEANANLVRRIAARLPVVVGGGAYLEECYHVDLNHAEGMRMAVGHLARLGHERIAFVVGEDNIYQSRVKLHAYREALAGLDLPVRDEYAVDGVEYSIAGGLAGMNRLLGLPEPPTAVIGCNDMIAAGAIQAILRLGYSVPEDFSVIGFDDSLITDVATPHITSVHHDYRAYGERLIGTAIAAIRGEACERLNVLPVSLSPKDSCQKAAKGL